MWTTENTAQLTAADIARLLPESWTYSFTDIVAALNFHRPGGIARREYRMPTYAPDGSQGMQLIETRANGTVTYGWLTPATPTAADPTEVWRTLDAGPWITVGRGDIFAVAESLGYVRAN